MEIIVTVKELASFLKLTEATIYKLVSSGELPGFKIGDSWRFELEEIQKMIRDSKKKGRKQGDPIEEKEERKKLLEKDQ